MTLSAHKIGLTEERNLPIDHVGVAYDSSNLGVSVSTLRPLVDVRTADNSKAIVHDAHLAMDVHLLRRQHVSA